MCAASYANIIDRSALRYAVLWDIPFSTCRLIDMRPFVRILTIWILIVSLAVQGSAVAITAPCTMGHPSETGQHVDDCGESAAMLSKTPQQADVDLAQQELPCHDGCDRQHTSCQSCSGCCAGASAPPPVAASALTAEHFDSGVTSPVSSFKGWIPSLLDRPPAHDYRLADLRLPYERLNQSSLVSRPWRGELSLRSS